MIPFSATLYDIYLVSYYTHKNGRVVQHHKDKCYNDNGDFYLCYYYSVEYFLKDSKYTIKSNRTYETPLSLGSKVDVIMHPENITDIRINTFHELWILHVIFLIITLLVSSILPINRYIIDPIIKKRQSHRNPSGIK